MAAYIEGRTYSMKAGERVSVRTASRFHIRTLPSSTARVYLDENRPETLTNISANTSMWLTLPPGCNSASVEAIGDWVVLNAGTGVPDTSVRYW